MRKFLIIGMTSVCSLGAMASELMTFNPIKIPLGPSVYGEVAVKLNSDGIYLAQVRKLSGSFGDQGGNGAVLCEQRIRGVYSQNNDTIELKGLGKMTKAACWYNGNGCYVLSVEQAAPVVGGKMAQMEALFPADLPHDNLPACL